MKVNQKEKLLIFILAVALLLVVYVVFLVPSMLRNIDALRSENEELEKKISEVQEMGNVIKDYKVLNMKIGAFLKGYFQQLNQEELILTIDDLLKVSGAESEDIAFSSMEESEKLPNLDNYPFLNAEVNFSGSASAVLNYLENIGKFNKKILVSELSINTENNNIDLLKGKIGLQFLAVSSNIAGGSASKTVYPGNKGNSNPFSTSSVVNVVPGVDLAKLLLDQVKGGNSDFTLTANPDDADLPNVVLGLENDRQAESYVYANNPEVENVEVRLFKKSDGKYYYQYGTEEMSYPEIDEGKEIPFATGNTQIVMKVYSEQRKGSNDQSTVSLSIYNETDLPFVIEIKTEDFANPRVKYNKLQGNISVYNSQGVLIQSGNA